MNQSVFGLQLQHENLPYGKPKDESNEYTQKQEVAGPFDKRNCQLS